MIYLIPDHSRHDVIVRIGDHMFALRVHFRFKYRIEL